MKERPADDVVDIAGQDARARAAGMTTRIFTREDLKRSISYHAAIRDKYARAARYPWLSVPPDTPEPE